LAEIVARKKQRNEDDWRNEANAEIKLLSDQIRELKRRLANQEESIIAYQSRIEELEILKS